MRRLTQVGGVLSGVGGALLLIYYNDAKDFLDELLSRLFGIPKASVGFWVVAVIIVAFLA